ncbi:hypothetical protein LWH94_09380 [Marinobacter sp. G11]|uniref:hypothetical protein n=1 Tax=Marinobacter sp. G11 TaxID=2903522 RepID=UPI001E2ACA0D|nr:hypothetical protein [Marinobacter sp. G11]MCE0759415.1 hypothetical protein [Marinobacter sp. G11]
MFDEHKVYEAVIEFLDESPQIRELGDYQDVLAAGLEIAEHYVASAQTSVTLQELRKRLRKRLPHEVTPGGFEARARFDLYRKRLAYTLDDFDPERLLTPQDERLVVEATLSDIGDLMEDGRWPCEEQLQRRVMRWLLRKRVHRRLKAPCYRAEA